MAPPVKRIDNGTFFGECLVDCNEVITVSDDAMTYSLTSPRPDPAHPDIEVQVAGDPRRWQELLAVLDLDVLRSLPGRIGDPDSADTGAEFVAVRSGDAATRVEFEAQHPPAQLHSLLEPLHRLRAELRAEHGRR